VRRSGGFAGVQGQVEALGVADDHRPVGVGAGAGRVEPEPGRIEAQAALLVTDQQAEMRQGHGQVDLQLGGAGGGLEPGTRLFCRPGSWR
jgi:hypothetical protein